jgi:hypothetical protein
LSQFRVFSFPPKLANVKKCLAIGRSHLLTRVLQVAALLSLLSLPSLASAQTATITWNKTYQTIDGFGASIGTNYGPGASLNSTQAALFFSPTTGVGF